MSNRPLRVRFARLGPNLVLFATFVFFTAPLVSTARQALQTVPMPLLNWDTLFDKWTLQIPLEVGRDEARGLAIAARLDTGMCHINCSSVNDEPHVPFGGAKASGLGRHGGRWSHETFTETRWITLDRGGRPYPPMF